MLGTYTVELDSVVAWLMTLVMVAGLFYFINRRDKRQAEEGRAKREAERAKDELRQKRDHQLNHGRRVYHWLVKELAQYRDMGIRVDKIEENGNHFSIFIGEEDESVAAYGGPGYAGSPILQIDFDFVGRPAPYVGHIHYGAYGADILFWVGDHAPTSGLDRLVLEEVSKVVSQRNKTFA
jgi:hypothetical protein